ncbi:hypothetical protein F5Y17DRAFT_463185 [Xylariaceae sp. FL0594]|nr:hypothetical protein F5Y17DRAFT_463185 [Xylariaceae sp. FL0594]
MSQHTILYRVPHIAFITLLYITSTPPPAPANATLCPEHGCNFTTTGRQKGLLEHSRHSHIGRVCFWRTGDDTVCGHTTATDQEFVKHYNEAHLSGAVMLSCPWPGFPGWADTDVPSGLQVNARAPAARSSTPPRAPNAMPKSTNGISGNITRPTTTVCLERDWIVEPGLRWRR